MNDREKLLHDITTLHNTMREEVIAAGVQPGQYDYPIRYKEKMTTEQLEVFYAFLQAFAEGPYANVMKVRRLRPAEFWHNLTILFQQHSLLEQKLLRKEQKRLRESWYATSV